MTLLMLSIMASLLFLLMSHPLSLGLMLLIQTISIALITGMMNYNYWFSYIIFLIMIGGMLVLFIYMTSIASNEKFKFSLTTYSIINMLIILTFIFMFLDSYFMSMQMTMDLITQNINFNFKFSLTKFINWDMLNNFMLIIIYLLITLIAVVKITNIQMGPLRQKF